MLEVVEEQFNVNGYSQLRRDSFSLTVNIDLQPNWKRLKKHDSCSPSLLVGTQFCRAKLRIEYQ